MYDTSPLKNNFVDPKSYSRGLNFIFEIEIIENYKFIEGIVNFFFNTNKI